MSHGRGAGSTKRDESPAPALGAQRGLDAAALPGKTPTGSKQERGRQAGGHSEKRAGTEGRYLLVPSRW